MITIRDTPLDGAWPVPALRPGGIAAELLPAFLPVKDQAITSKLSHPDVIAVTTGQQPGLFTGPLYTVYKALSARGLALALEARWGRPVISVFWLAGDDHDFAEAAVTHWIGQDGQLATAELAARPPDAPQRPLHREVLGDEIDGLLDRLTIELPDGPARAETVAWLRRHYRSGATIAQGYGGALNELLAPLGVVCFDPTHPAAKRAAAPLVRTALNRARDLDVLLAARHGQLALAGPPPDVRVGDGAALVFLEGDLGRDRLVLAGDGFDTRRGKVHLSLEAVNDLLAQEPDRFSPNVLLRPVVENFLLPTVAYLGGPGELSYLALAEALFAPLGVPRPLPIPRWSGLLIEARVARTLAKFGVRVEDAIAAPGEVEQRLVRSLAPADFEAAFHDTRQALEAGFDRLQQVARQIDPTVEKPVQSSRTTIQGQLHDLEKRLLAAQKRRQGELIGQWDRVRTALRPNDQAQERVLGIPGFVGRYGFDVVGQLADHIADWFRAALEARRSRG